MSMKYIKTDIPGVLLVEPKVFKDSRGFFMETFHQNKYAEAGIDHAFIQDNFSHSAQGTLRGLHYQLSPYTQAKLVRVIEGSVLDVTVDIREYSPTFGQHVTVELTGKNKHQLFVPHGFAHGFVVLSDSATFAYKVDNYYVPELERGIAFNDSKLNIDWKLAVDELHLSDRDKTHPDLSDVLELFE